MARDKFAKWGKVSGTLRHTTRVGRDAFAESDTENTSAAWQKCTESDPNRGTIRKGRATWAKARA